MDSIKRLKELANSECSCTERTEKDFIPCKACAACAALYRITEEARRELNALETIYNTPVERDRATAGFTRICHICGKPMLECGGCAL